MQKGVSSLFLAQVEKRYLIIDNHRDSPVGFGVKTSAAKKRHHPTTSGFWTTSGKAPLDVIRATMGNVSDFANIDQARETARNFDPTHHIWSSHILYCSWTDFAHY
ncbi:hypothetical protein [Pectobacterium sp. B1J-3]|uniref:hypothetical protein n=1 Tax=Pectobacterium sp. B1J-3 TaxID=3385371 RepID=UPI0039066E4F